MDVSEDKRAVLVAAVVPPDLKARLVAAARADDRSVSSLIRLAVTEHLARNRAKQEQR